MNTAADQSGVQISFTPKRRALLQGQDNVVEVLIQVEAPTSLPQSEFARNRLNIALVIDRSTSMNGRPLAHAKRCAKFMLSRLRENDRVAIVQFDNEVNVLLATDTPAESHYALVDTIIARGNTDLHAGWLAGAEQLAPFAETNALQRVVLLSDGCANSGLTDTTQIIAQCGELASAGVTTSTYGLGRSFNEDLMVAMSESGHGNHYYGITAEDLFEPFVQEFDLLENLWLRNVCLSVSAIPGIEMSILNRSVLPGHNNVWNLPNLAVGSAAWVLARLVVPANLLGMDPQSLLKATVRGTAADGTSLVYENEMDSLDVLPPVAFSAVAENALVSRRCVELEAASLLLNCRRAAAKSDWSAVDTMVADALTRFGENAWVTDMMKVFGNLAEQRNQALTMKEALYSSSSLRNRLTNPKEIDDLSIELDSSSYLRRRSSMGSRQFVSPVDPRTDTK